MKFEIEITKNEIIAKIYFTKEKDCIKYISEKSNDNFTRVYEKIKNRVWIVTERGKNEHNK